MPAKEEAIKELYNVHDPELGMSIMDIGLVYNVDVNDNEVRVEYTLTSPGCPAGEIIEQDIIYRLKKLGFEFVIPDLVWDPMWGPERMSDEARLMLGYPI